MGDVWGWISIAAILAVGLAGIPFLGRGGGRLGGRRGRGRGRDTYRVRVGPSTPVLLLAAMLRRLDTVLLVAATITVGVLIWLNARA
ncbi:hypothetical protein NE236_42975 [Actinoallomurus purpureus]|uniref:hypothetical protein n=1 Tax=Actinoallomurus purpureus TaxID=478114 RepID=UPI0020925DC6|nr:hypothetical protein [Actinoallomurus purpureus]MCO6011731.1 hypothetical protein [Actinoallomurus purpureus]